MKKLACVVGLLVAVAVGLVFAQDIRKARGDTDTELAFFFSDSTPDLEASARALGGLRTKHPSLRIRPVFLAQDFASIAKPSTEFALGIRELRVVMGQDFSVRVYDEEGLALARQLKLDRLPAYALILDKGKRQQAFVAYGTKTNLEELVRCEH